VLGALRAARAAAREITWLQAGKKEEPTAAITDSQSVKGDATVPAATRGFDAGKRINGRYLELFLACPSCV
jgi:hypothetical protein